MAAIPEPVQCFSSRQARRRPYTQRRTRTPFTTTQRQAATGARTTAAPPAATQPARTTPRAQTTAFASEASIVMNPANAVTARAANITNRIVSSPVRDFYGSRVRSPMARIYVNNLLEATSPGFGNNQDFSPRTMPIGGLSPAILILTYGGLGGGLSKARVAMRCCQEGKTT